MMTMEVGVIMDKFEGIQAAFGEDYLSKYKQAISKNRGVERFNEEKRSLALKNIVEKLVDGKTRVQYFTGTGSDAVVNHVVLALAWKDLRARQLDGVVSMQFVDNDFWFSALIPQDDVQRVLPDEMYVLVGSMYDVKKNDRVYNNMRVSAVFSLDEIVAYRESRASEESETSSALANHQ